MDFLKSLNNLTILKKGIDSTAKLNYNITMQIANTNTSTTASVLEIANLLKDRTVRYINQGKSSVRRDKERTFKIHAVEDVWNAKKNGKRCLKVLATDIDDHGFEKYRTLHLTGIEVVA